MRTGSGVFFLLLFLSLRAHSAFAEEDPVLFDFMVLRDGQPFGHHLMVIYRKQDRIEVDNKADADVFFGPFRLFIYRYQSHEVWEKGRLRSIVATTNDDGEESSVTAKAEAGGLQGRGPEGQIHIPDDIKPTSRSYSLMSGNWQTGVA